MKNIDCIAKRQVSYWLAAGVIMVLVQILLGGITRLTGSGLSITEWQPLIGILPPLNHADWTHSFNQYQQIAQFKKLNNHFTLDDFKSLYFWEWLHREWARLMGLIFIIPFFVFLLQRKFNRHQGWQLAGLFLLGIVQAFAGWVMVQSGLNDTDIRVSHIRLAVHFILALLLLVYLFWMFLALRFPKNSGTVLCSLRLLTIIILLVLGLQLIYGAFMAGLHAALYAPTWPDINGAFLPSSSGSPDNLWNRLFYDPLSIQFVHRLLGYLLFFLFLSWFILVGRLSPELTLSRIKNLPVVLLLLQVALGISCLLFAGTPLFIWLAVLHQLNGIMLLLSMIGVLYLMKNRNA